MRQAVNTTSFCVFKLVCVCKCAWYDLARRQRRAVSPTGFSAAGLTMLVCFQGRPRKRAPIRPQAARATQALQQTEAEAIRQAGDAFTRRTDDNPDRQTKVNPGKNS